MKKWLGVLLALGVTLSLCGCGGAVPRGPGASSGGGSQGGTGGSGTADQGGGPADTGGELSLLYHMQRQAARNYTENGYYYLTLEEDRLADGRNGRHLMYMDFAARREICLCSSAACSHNTADCPSVFPSDVFAQSTALFVMDDGLYILSKEQDHDGAAMMGVLGGDPGTAVEAAPTVLYRAELDGTGREKCHTFDPAVTVEDLVLGDGEGLYVITKKVVTEQGAGYTYQTSSERKLCRLDLSTGKEETLFSLDFGGGIDWDVAGCAGRKLVLYGIDFGREVLPEEKYAEDNSLYENSEGVFATLDVDSGSLCEIYRAPAPFNDAEVVGNKLYLGEDGKIISVDLQTAEQDVLCTIAQSYIWGAVGDQLYTVDDDDRTLYFIDTESGSVRHCGLVERTIGTSLKIVASTSDQVLVIYDTDAAPKGDGSFIVYGYKYGLIGKDDLFSGRDRFQPIQMIGSGR